ncbi:hypothetical protein [Streptomyces sp. NPDC020141]|uniref:hypothetical protein n=1 Tax=Streptomyces sp. NPDC020141 TaxID=3365065 RepID=UPI0037AB3F89
MTVTTRLADAVQRAAERAVEQLSTTWGLATVTVVQTDGTVDVTTATGPVARVRRLRSYGNPLVGDVVQVLRSPAGNWLIVGALTTSTSGWRSLSMAPGMSAGGGATDPPPAARRTVDGTTVLSGVIAGATLTTSADVTLATIPTECRPTYKATAIVGGSTSVMRLTVSPNGDISARLITGASPGFIAIDSVVCR